MGTVFRVGLLIAYIVIYLFLAFVGTGGGHGNFYLITVPFYPLLLLFVPVILLGRLDNQRTQIIFIVLMVVHYLLLFGIFFSGAESFNEGKGWAAYGIPMIHIGWYLVGQVAIWLAFCSEKSGLTFYSEKKVITLFK